MRLEQRWDRAWQEKILEDAMDTVKTHVNEVTFQAFKLTYQRWIEHRRNC